MIDIEISIDVVEMIEFKGLSRLMISNMTEEGGNETLARNQIGFPSSLFTDALKNKLASGELVFGLVCMKRKASIQSKEYQKQTQQLNAKNR